MKNIKQVILFAVILFSFSACSSISRNDNKKTPAVEGDQATVTKTSDNKELKRTSFHSEWSYNGETGPAYWENLSQYYSKCGCGHSQSPIDVEPQVAEHISEQLNISYTTADIDFINNGHTIKEMVHTKNSLTFGDKVYQLIQFHFHTPAEHYFNHEQAPMELHFVHMSKDKDVAVMGIFVKESILVNPTFSLIEKYAPKHKSEEIVDKYIMDLNQFLPKNLSFYHYSGSLTTPPCSEGVKWLIMDHAIGATKDQIESIHSIIHDDNRPLQSLDGRHIYTSN